MKFGMIGFGRMGANMVRHLGGGHQWVAYDTHKAARAVINKSWGQLLASIFHTSLLVGVDAKRAALKQGAAARMAP